MSTPEETRMRTELLKKLREDHAVTVSRTQALLKEQKHIQQEVCKFIRDTPKTVPDIAAAVGLPTEKVLWYMASFRKYGLVVEKGMCGDYPLYQKAEENKK